MIIKLGFKSVISRRGYEVNNELPTPFPIEGLVAYYKLDEETGTTVIDSVGGYNGALLGTPQVNQEGKVNKSILFNTNNTYVNVPTLPLSGNSSHTIAGWFYTSGPSTARMGMLTLRPQNTGGHHWLLNTNGTMTLGRWGAGSAGVLSTAWPRNEWFHLATTYSNVTRTLKVYINGVFNIQLILPTTQPFALTGGIAIGQGVSAEHEFNGRIDEVGIWNRELTQEEVTYVATANNGLSNGGNNNTLFSDITDLKVDDLTKNQIELSFRKPWSKFGISHYDVYVDGIFNSGGYNNNNEVYAINLTSDTNYNISVKAIDINNNQSSFSNEVITKTQKNYPTTGLISYYKLDEIDGADQTVIDSWGNHNGLNGALRGQAGKINSAYSFNGGISNRIDFPSFTSITESDFTVCFWAQQLSQATPAVFSQHLLGTWANNLFIFYVGEPGAEVRVWWSGASVITYAGSPGTSTVFKHYLLRRTGNLFELFINGILVTSGSRTASWASNYQGVGVTKNGATYLQSYKGLLDELAIWNRPLTQEEINQIYNNGNGSTI